MTLRILHVKNRFEARQEKYGAMSAVAGWLAPCSAQVQNNIPWSLLDVVHLHTAPDGESVHMLRRICRLPAAERPGVVVDVDDDMMLLLANRELDPVRSGEIEACREILHDCLAEFVVANEPYLDLWPGSTLIRNFPTIDQISEGERAQRKPYTSRFQKSVYIGSLHDSPRHHRFPGNWTHPPDVVIESGLTLVESVRMMGMFTHGSIPFRPDRQTNTLETHKLFEYLCAGCTVVHDGLTQVQKMIDQFGGRMPVPSFESQSDALLKVYEAAIRNKARVRFE